MFSSTTTAPTRRLVASSGVAQRGWISFSIWHIAKFGGTAKIGRNRGMADIAGSVAGSTQSCMTLNGNRRPLRAKGAQMQEVGYALPAAASTGNNGVFRKGRLAKRLDQEPGLLQRYEIGFQRAMLAIERHRQAIALDRISVTESIKIVAFDDEVPVGGRFFEAPSGVDRMNYR